MSDPLDQETLQELRFSSGRHVEPVVAAPSTIAEGIRTAYEGELAELVNNLPAHDVDSEDDRTLRAAAAAWWITSFNKPQPWGPATSTSNRSRVECASGIASTVFCAAASLSPGVASLLSYHGSR